MATRITCTSYLQSCYCRRCTLPAATTAAPTLSHSYDHYHFSAATTTTTSSYSYMLCKPMQAESYLQACFGLYSTDSNDLSRSRRERSRHLSIKPCTKPRPPKPEPLKRKRRTQRPRSHLGSENNIYIPLYIYMHIYISKYLQICDFPASGSKVGTVVGICGLAE